MKAAAISMIGLSVFCSVFLVISNSRQLKASGWIFVESTQASNLDIGKNRTAYDVYQRKPFTPSELRDLNEDDQTTTKTDALTGHSTSVSRTETTESGATLSAASDAHDLDENANSNKGDKAFDSAHKNESETKGSEINKSNQSTTVESQTNKKEAVSDADKHENSKLESEVKSSAKVETTTTVNTSLKLETPSGHPSNDHILSGEQEAVNNITTPLHSEKQNDKPTSEAKEWKPLNILILYPDDMRHDSLSSAGTQLVQTPFLDRLASEGIRFTHNCVTTSICWISRATLFSGQYVSRHSSDKLFRPRFCDQAAWNSSWPYLLQQNGYFVGHVGKWQFRNFDWVKTAFNWTRLFEGQHWHKIRGKMVHTTDYTQQATIDFLRERPKDRPFAATVAFYPPKAISGLQIFNPKPESLNLYTNLSIPEAFDINNSWARLNRKVFTDRNHGRVTWKETFGTPDMYQKNMKDMYRLITEVDEACRNIVEELKKQGILNQTLVIFTTDNGFIHGEHGLSGKWFPYQESIRVPLIVRDPRMPESKIGTLDDSFTLNLDLAPTILGAAKVDVPPGMQGRDFSDLYLKPTEQVKWRNEFYYEHPTHLAENRIPKSSALVRKDFKYMKFDNMEVEHLFNLEMDPLEQNDLLGKPEFTDKLTEMRKRYKELKVAVQQPPPYKGITF